MNGPVRVSHVATYKRWREDEETDIGLLINQLCSAEETEAKLKGTAFHKALELASASENYFIHSDGYTFHFTGEMTIALSTHREIRRAKDYGGIVVSGQADGVEGRTCTDYKTTEHFDAERYLGGVQHNFYMDIFDLDAFRWFVFEMKEMDEPKNYCVHNMHELVQYRYPGMTEDCRALALEFKTFAEKWLPDWKPSIGNAPRREDSPSATMPQGGGVGTRTDVTTPDPWQMHATKGRNLIGVGWRDGVLRCAFASKEGKRFYCYGNVPEAEFDKLRHSPYPDKLFTSNIKGKFSVQAEAA